MMWLLAGRMIVLYKLILLDIDGTLRDECYGIPNSAKQAIKQCALRGCKIVICTGRSMGTIQDDVLALPVDGYIAGGGSYLRYHDNSIYDVAFHRDLMASMLVRLKTSKVAFAIESQEAVYMNAQAKAIFDALNQAKGSIENVHKQFIQEKIQYVDNLADYDAQPIHKLCIWANEEIYNDIMKIANQSVTLVQTGVFESLRYYELIQKGYDKGNAIQTLQNILGIGKAETVCFGDGQNDIAMFQEAELAVAMKHSHADLKKIATTVCEAVMEDGIYKELKRQGIL